MIPSCIYLISDYFQDYTVKYPLNTTILIFNNFYTVISAPNEPVC